MLPALVSLRAFRVLKREIFEVHGRVARGERRGLKSKRAGGGGGRIREFVFHDDKGEVRQETRPSVRFQLRQKFRRSDYESSRNGSRGRELPDGWRTQPEAYEYRARRLPRVLNR